MKLKRFLEIKASITLILVAVLVLSCGEDTRPPTITDPETTPTRTVINLKTMESLNGVRVRRLEAPILEEFDEAAEPYQEFKKGGKVEMFASDSVTIESDFVADYVTYNKTKRLWDARGNVVARNIIKNQTLYTQQLYWDEGKKKIYTDKQAKVVDKGNVHIGIGFETDEKFEQYSFTNARGQFEIDDTKDSTRNNQTEPIEGIVPTDSTNQQTQ